MKAIKQLKQLGGLIIGIFLSIGANAQDPEGFNKMATNMAKHKAPVIHLEKIKNLDDYLILDAREKSEYDVSHIPGAVWVGYDDFEMSRVPDSNKPVLVYCSVGYRSGKIAEKIEEKKSLKAYNLYGGLFHYANSKKPMVDIKGNSTKQVHGYNKKWSQWLNEEVCEPQL